MSGIVSMKDNKNDFEELCKLIEVCNTNNVKEIKYLGVELIFFEEYVKKDGPSNEVPFVKAESINAPEAIMEVDPAILQQLEADIKQAELDQMMINDPVQFEELLNCGDFENGSDD